MGTNQQQDNETVKLKYIIVFYLHKWKYFLISGIVSVLLAAFYLLCYPKTFEIAAKIRMQEDKSLGNSGIGLGEAAGIMRSFGLGNGGTGAVNLDDEWAILSSNQLLRDVVYDLGLDISYSKPFSFIELYQDSPIKIIPDSAFRTNIEEEFALKLNIKQGKVSVTIKQIDKSFSFDSFPFLLTLPQGSLFFTNKTDNKELSYTLNILIKPGSWIAEDLSEKINIEEFSKSSNTLELLYQDYNKKRGSDILNLMMLKFNVWTDSIKKTDSKKAISFLEGRINGVLSQLDQVEQEIEEYKLKNKITDVEYDLQFYAEAVKLLREKIVELEVQNHLMGLVSTFVKDPTNKYNLIPALTTSSEGESQNAISVYNEALIQYEKMKHSTKTENPLSSVSENQLSKMRENAILSIENAHNSIQYALNNLQKQETEIFNKMENVPTYEREFVELRRQQEILQGVYLILLQKKEEVALSVGKEQDRGLIIDKPYTKFQQVAPRKLYAGLFIIVFTILIPIISLFMRDRIKEIIEAYKDSAK